MNALILAGGKGERMQPFTRHTPKVMARIGEMTLVQRLLHQLDRCHQIEHIFVNISCFTLPVASHISELANPRVSLLYEEELLGPASTVIELSKKYPDDLLAIHGDMLLQSDTLEQFAEECHTSDCARLVLHERERSDARTIVKVDSFMNVTSIEIAPVKLQNRVSSNQLVHVDSGIYYFPQEVLGNVPQFHAISPVISLISTLSETKVLKGFMGTGKRFAIEDVESLQKAQAFYAHHPEIFD